MISPILTYNSEVWGDLQNQILSRGTAPQLKKTHLQFCKRYLEVHNKASNIARRAALGKFPLIIDINKKILLLKLPPRKGRKLYSQTIFKTID